MVVAHPATAHQPPATAPSKRKNRRKLHKKPTSAPNLTTPQEPHASSSHTEPSDDQLADITDTLSQPIDTSSLFPVPQQSTDTTADDDDDDELMIDTSVPSLSAPTAAPVFPPAAPSKNKAHLAPESRRVPVPPHRMTPLKKDWVNIFGPLTEILGLQVRMNVQRRCVEIRTSKFTKDIGAIQKGADFVKAYTLGFDVNDAITLLRMDDLYLDSFEIKDVKTLQGDHLSRAIGRIAGQDGKTKFTIENASRTRIVLADTKIHIMGSFQNIKIARDAIVSLILGSPPGKVYAGLRTVSSRMRQRAL
ncbi:eukaryotic type KH-domain (KH-domain type I) [Macrolepiota fuliginosa MF-IS2]|uniref:Pre-rRNA-processing protein PNO1 n=1 Tax=Macrolepiota fuliginosa MF-IS2 TaxID=1400762 RepID=A0A9P6C1K6_9AGAR|nr:eukaryotic type KH-domain (KH-domain type I) [Macrolepiota fuliginosa MF-IS2]